MTDRFEAPQGATPLDPAERDGLLQSWIADRGDLNAAEQANIVKATAWARRRRIKAVDVLGEEFVRTLHRRMFGDVWRWAGTYRRSERNIGIEAHRIASEMAALLDDARYWVAHGTYPADELAVRLHHRLTAVHAFPNGNGRHARLLADVLVARLGGVHFSWGGAHLSDGGALRAKYIAALKAADGHDIRSLLVFARS